MRNIVGTENDSEDKGHDLDAESPDESSDEYFEEGDAGDLYDDFVVDDKETGDEEEYNGDGVGGEDDEDEELDSDENAEDVHMNDNCGVNAKTLAMMEEEEDGW
ncbi:hypothetical protein PtA15_8A439 [Puccinia triticina]|uniref:Uncharacterized protein n=1 Tax=Puccinia triticina TaxID=208348 RepID=A0ABY7CR81_9BASI|nr:uncharacterized protein PtA15_8A439 [Puccinia triticina]WAQ87535.1 hypothetical protein PtA15_8A439 [Puccinia triticina]